MPGGTGAGDGAGGGGGGGGRLSRELYSQFAAHALSVLQQQEACPLQRAGRLLRRARSAQRALRRDCLDTPLAPLAPRAPAHSPDIEDALDNIENGQFFEFLQASPILTDSDMKVDTQAVDIDKSIEHLKTLREELEARTAGYKPTGLTCPPLDSEEMSLRSELDHCAEAINNFNNKFASIELDESSDSTRRRNLEVEDKIRKMAGIIDSINMIVEAKSQILKLGEGSEKLNPPPKILGSHVIDEILCQTENVTYALVNGQ